jgi:hypothetical protein
MQVAYKDAPSTRTRTQGNNTTLRHPCRTSEKTMQPCKLFMEINVEASTYPALLIPPWQLSPTPTRTSSIQEDTYLYMNTRHEHTDNTWKPARWRKQASNQSYLYALMHIRAAAKHRRAQTIGWCWVLPNSEHCPTRLLQQALETILRWFNNCLKPRGFLPITRMRVKELKKNAWARPIPSLFRLGWE